MKKLSTKQLISAAAFAIILLLCAFLLFARKQKGVRPRVGPIVEAVYALGTIRSYNVYNLKVAISTNIQKLHVSEGAEVVKGQILMTNNDGTSFYAPFQGTVTRLYSNEDEMVIPGATVLTVMDLGKKYIQVSLDQHSALLVKKKQKVQISGEILRGATIEGRVESIYPSDGQFIARITSEAMPREILPDMTADVAIETARRDSALLIPLSAARGGAVELYRQGKKISLSVPIGAIDGEWGEVLENKILPDDEIIIDK